MLTLKDLRVNYQSNPLGVVEAPCFGWKIESSHLNTMQKSYRLQVASNEQFLEPLYDSGMVISNESAHVRIKLALASATRYYYRVKITGSNNEESAWSESAFFVTGLLDNADWRADFISAESPQNSGQSDTRYIRKEFKVKNNVSEAYVCVTALGLYELFMNGKRVGNAHLAPGWTSYNHHLLYQTYDVTDLVNQGENAIGAMLGAGWYKGDLCFDRRRNMYGKQTALLCQLHLRYADGSEEIFASDSSWKGAPAPVLFSEIYDGETYDARLEQPGWSETGFDDASWSPVSVVNKSKSILRSQIGSLVKEIETIPAKKIFTTPENDLVIDFGQNMSGWVRFAVEGERGSRVVLKHAETLDAKGNFYTANLRTAKQTTEYILKGEGVETFEPHFTFQGFRYIKLEEYPQEPALDNFTAVVLHSEMERTGTFECSNSDVNQLQHNILWGLKSNFVDIPSDCPQRDERLGWTGDAQIFIRTACYLMNTYSFYSKWLYDLKAEQFEDGGVPFIVPDVLSKRDEPKALWTSAAAWSDAALICPWTLYLVYGDKIILENQYDSMKAWVEYIRGNAQDEVLWNTGFQFGDWVALDAKEGSSFGATPTDLIATAYYAYSTDILAKTAKLLGKVQDAEFYQSLYKRIVKAFHDEFYTPNGRLAARTQTAHILPLMFDLVPENYRNRTVNTLLELIRENDGHLTTGFVGTPYLCHALSRNGQTEAAFDLLLKDDYPSWLYQVKQGATTVWEHWDGLKPDGTMWSTEMNSFNHYAYGAIGDWLYRVAGGIEIDENYPGYKHFILNPHIGGNFSFVNASYRSIYGEIQSNWKVSDDKVTYHFAIPPNTTAKITLGNVNTVLNRDGLDFTDEKGKLTATVGSGTYRISYTIK